MSAVTDRMSMAGLSKWKKTAFSSKRERAASEYASCSWKEKRGWIRVLFCADIRLKRGLFWDKNVTV